MELLKKNNSPLTAEEQGSSMRLEDVPPGSKVTDVDVGLFENDKFLAPVVRLYVVSGVGTKHFVDLPYPMGIFKENMNLNENWEQPSLIISNVVDAEIVEEVKKPVQELKAESEPTIVSEPETLEKDFVIDSTGSTN